MYLPSVLWHCWLGGRTGIRPVKMGGWWRWAMFSPDGVATSWLVGVSASVSLPLHHKVQKFSSGTGSPGWSRKKGRKMTAVSYVLYTAWQTKWPLLRCLSLLQLLSLSLISVCVVQQHFICCLSAAQFTHFTSSRYFINCSFSAVNVTDKTFSLLSLIALLLEQKYTTTSSLHTSSVSRKTLHWNKPFYEKRHMCLHHVCHCLLLVALALLDISWSGVLVVLNISS